MGNHYSATGSYTFSVSDVTAGIPNDLASDIGTTAMVIVGGRSSGEIEYDGIRNWLKGSLAAGKTYLVDLGKRGGS